MEFIGTGEEESEDFSPNVSALLLNSGDSVVDALSGGQVERFLEKQFYPRSIVVQDTRVSRGRVVL